MTEENKIPMEDIIDQAKEVQMSKRMSGKQKIRNIKTAVKKFKRKVVSKLKKKASRTPIQHQS